jgi:hypothetical protein
LISMILVVNSQCLAEVRYSRYVIVSY